MRKAEEIIKQHLAEINKRMDDLVSYELDMADLGCPLSDKERETNDRKWNELMARKVELLSLLSDIEDVAISYDVC